ncbi:MAG: hypothetical protein COA49_05850 [Bacteroidetes bacterium]|nr:MAG: hypothetical protein COA49_05850 [Bacteroidota bacterium]
MGTLNSLEVLSQNDLPPISGEVSFVTSQNVYLRFPSTENMFTGDTVYIARDGIETPCIIILEKSSVSCVAEVIGGCDIEKGASVIYHYRINQDSKVEEVDNKTTGDKTSGEPLDIAEELNKRSQEVSGRFSLSNNTTFGYGESYSKRVARLALDVKNIAGSKLSFQSYSNYRNLNNNRLNIHEAILTYELDSSTTISLGRDINNRMYSLGATDGLHAEKRFKRSFVGIVVGSRPDPYTYSVNTNLFQYGVNVGVFHNDAHSSSTSIGFIDQTNRGLTDRRYAFLQHNSRVGKDLTIYSSAEVDLYNSAHLRLLYTSANYRVNDKLRLSASLNLRKNLILYESFNQDLVELMANDPLKSSIRFRANYRISNRVYSGASFSIRRQEDGNNNFSNFGGYLNFSELLGGRLSNSFSVNKNDYFQYYSISSRYSRQFFNSKLEVSPNARFLLYSYHNFDINPIKQLYIGIDSDYYVKEGLSVSALYDFSARSGAPFHRFTVRILQRF